MRHKIESVGASELSDGRLLVCVGCGQRVLVHELPRPFIDPARFRCGPCLDGQQHQLKLDPRPAETRPYDPQQAEIPY